MITELTVTVRGRPRRPTPLRRRSTVGEVQILIGHLTNLPIQREIARHRQPLRTLLLQLPRRRDPLVLMHRVPRQQERQQIPHPPIVGQVIQPRHLHPTLHLGIRIGLEIGQQIPTRRDVGALPRIPVAVHRPSPRTRHDRLLHIRTTDHRRDHRISRHRSLRGSVRRLLQQLRDYDRQHLHMTELLRPDPVQQIPILPRNLDVPRLEPVLHRHGDLAVLTTEHLLQLPGIDRIRCVGLARVLQLLLVEEHGYPSTLDVRDRTGAVPRRAPVNPASFLTDPVSG